MGEATGDGAVRATAGEANTAPTSEVFWPTPSPARAQPSVESPWRTSDAWWVRRGVGPYLILIDVAACVIAMAITMPGSPQAHGLAVLFLLLVFWCVGLYRSRLELSLLDDLPYVLAAVFVAWTFKGALFSVLSG